MTLGHVEMCHSGFSFLSFVPFVSQWCLVAVWYFVCMLDQGQLVRNNVEHSAPISALQTGHVWAVDLPDCRRPTAVCLH